MLAQADAQDILSRPEKSVLAQGILPATDAIVTIPQSFGAICLNNTGMDLFIRSGALITFFEIFESPDHVKSMAHEGSLQDCLAAPSTSSSVTILN